MSSADAKRELEEGSGFAPKWNEQGLVPAIAQDEATGQVLMVAHMNEAALSKTIETGVAHYWSRSRGALWKKGETSGELQSVKAILTDCDQDVLLLKVRVEGRGSACHTGRVSCFYRQLETVEGRTALKTIDDQRLFNPDVIYR